MADAAFDELSSLSIWGAGAGYVPPRDLREAMESLSQEMLEAPDVAVRARLRHRVGYIALLAGDARTKGLEAFTLMLDGARTAANRRLEALALCGLAAVHDYIGERRQSLTYALEARQTAEQLGDQRLLANCLNEEAQFYKENGENPRAAALYERIKSIGEELQDERLTIAGHIGLGRTTEMSKAPAGIAHYEQALAIARQRNDPYATAVCLNNLADWMIYSENYARAIELREECLAIAKQNGMRAVAARALVGLAKAYSLDGDLAKAHSLLSTGFPGVAGAADIEGQLHCQLNLAFLYLKNGDILRATELYQSALEKSLAAPDHACAVFAQKALEMLADGKTPPPGIVPDREPDELDGAQLAHVAGGAAIRPLTYPTGDKNFHAVL